MSEFLDKSLQEADETLAELITQMPAEQREMFLRELERAEPTQSMDALYGGSQAPPNSSFEQVLANRVSEKSVEQDSGKSSDSFRLTNAEKDFFFGAPAAEDEKISDEGFEGVWVAGNEHEVPSERDVEVSAVEQDAAIYEDIMVTPILKDSRRLLYMNMCVLCTILIVMAIIGFMQSRIILRMEQNQSLLMRVKAPQVDKTAEEGPWKFFLLPGQEQRRQLEQKINSNLVSKEEKIYCYTMLATLSFQEGEYQQGRMYLLKGIQLKDEIQ